MPFPEGKAQATYGVTDTLMMFADSDVKEAAWKFIEFAYKDNWREKFDMGEGFLPVTKNVAALDHFTKDPDVAGFAAGLPYAKFAPIIPELGRNRRRDRAHACRRSIWVKSRPRMA